MRRQSVSALVGTSILLSACSTTQIRHADAPTFSGTTQRSLGEFQGCFARQFEGDDSQPSYLPKEIGGTYTMRMGLMQNYVSWVLDVDDDGSQRSVVLHAVDSIWGKNNRLVRRVEACL